MSRNILRETQRIEPIEKVTEMKLKLLWKNAFSCFTLLALCSCASQFQMPANRFESPEVRGKTGLAHFDVLGVQGGYALGLSSLPAKSNTQSDINATLDSAPLSLFSGATIGILKRAEAGFRFQTLGPLALHGKFQFIGNPESEANDGNFSVAAVATIGFTLNSSSNPSGSSFQNANTSFLNYDGGLVTGYRFNPSSLIYLGATYSSASYSGSLTDSKTNVTLSEYSGSATQLSFHLGYQYDIADLYFKVELARASATIPKLKDSLTGFFPGILLGLRF